MSGYCDGIYTLLMQRRFSFPQKQYDEQACPALRQRHFPRHCCTLHLQNSRRWAFLDMKGFGILLWILSRFILSSTRRYFRKVVILFAGFGIAKPLSTVAVTSA